MRRREFIAGLGGAPAWPLTMRGQRVVSPTPGLLGAGSPGPYAERLRRFFDFLVSSHLQVAET
jgi:hypothetical protein